jgi:tight adherence protein C
MIMPVWIWLAAAAIACSVPLAWWAVAGGRPGRSRVRANLEAGMDGFTDLRRAVLTHSAHDRVTQPAIDSLARRARRMTPSGMVTALEHKIELAGMGDSWPVDRVLALKLGGLIVGSLLGLLFFAGDPSLMGFLLFAVIAGIGWFGPDALIGHRADARQKEIERALADALDQITVCVESGLSFEAAVARVADRDGPLAEEFLHVLQDIQLGIPRNRALENLLERTDIADMRGFVHAFMHAERFGIPVAHVLRSQAAELRDKRKQRAEERAMKIPVKLVFPLTLCILPALFVVVAGPAVVRITNSFGM